MFATAGKNCTQGIVEEHKFNWVNCICNIILQEARTLATNNNKLALVHTEYRVGTITPAESAASCSTGQDVAAMPTTSQLSKRVNQSAKVRMTINLYSIPSIACQ